MLESSVEPSVSGMAMMANCAPTRGHAMMAEIERLVDAYGVAGGGAENKAALMAAIQRHIQE